MVDCPMGKENDDSSDCSCPPLVDSSESDDDWTSAAARGPMEKLTKEPPVFLPPPGLDTTEPAFAEQQGQTQHLGWTQDDIQRHYDRRMGCKAARNFLAAWRIQNGHGLQDLTLQPGVFEWRGYLANHPDRSVFWAGGRRLLTFKISRLPAIMDRKTRDSRVDFLLDFDDGTVIRLHPGSKSEARPVLATRDAVRQICARDTHDAAAPAPPRGNQGGGRGKGAGKWQVKKGKTGHVNRAACPDWGSGWNARTSRGSGPPPDREVLAAPRTVPDEEKGRSSQALLDRMAEAEKFYNRITDVSDAKLTAQEQIVGKLQALQTATEQRFAGVGMGSGMCMVRSYLANRLEKWTNRGANRLEKLTKEQMAGEPPEFQTATSANSRWANLENRMEFEHKALQLVAQQVARDIASASDRMESIEKSTKEQMSGELLELIQAADKAFDEAVQKSLRIVESMEKLAKEQQVDASK